MKRLLLLLLLLSLGAYGQVSFSGGVSMSGGITLSSATVTATTPTFSPTAGSYSGTQSVTISSGSCGSYIYWNTTGSPTTGDTHGTSASVASSETVYAKVISCPGYSDSAVGSAAYTISGSTPAWVGGAKNSLTTAATSIATSSSVTIGTGNFVYAIIGGANYSGLDGKLISLACGTNTLVLGRNWVDTVNGYAVAMYYKVNAASYTGTCTANFGANSLDYLTIAVGNWSNVPSTATLEASSCNDASCAAWAASSQNRSAQNITVTKSNVLLIGGGVDLDGGATYNATTNSYTARLSAGGVSGSTPFIADRFVSAPGAYPGGNFASTSSTAQQSVSIFGAFTW